MISTIRILSKLEIFNFARWLQAKVQSHDHKKLSVYKHFIKPGDLCFDVGANIGQKTEYFLRLNANVIAIEPQQSCFRFLSSIYKSNRNVTLVNKAIDETRGNKEILICEANAMSSMSEDWISKIKENSIWKDYRWNKKEEVETTSLDDLINQFGMPQFISIDVEGYELNVIKGLSRKVACLSFEMTPFTCFQLDNILNHLSNLGHLKINLLQDPTYAKGPASFVFKEWVGKSEILDYAEENKDSFFYDIFAEIR